MFLHENNRNYSSCIFSYKFAFIFFLSFLTNEKQEPGFQQVGGLETINISVFCLVALYFKAMPNSIDFYKGIFLHVIPVFFFCFCFFSIWVFFYEHSRITGLQRKAEGISTPHYHFHPLHRHLDIGRAITAGNSPLHIDSSRTRTRNLWFLSASR